jgi:hypothetical protein
VDDLRGVDACVGRRMVERGPDLEVAALRVYAPIGQ